MSGTRSDEGGTRDGDDAGRLSDGAVPDDPDEDEGADGESGLPPEGDDPMEGVAPTG